MGKLALLSVLITMAALAQGCTQILDDDLGGIADIGEGMATLPVAPSGPMAANLRVVSDPQGENCVSELSCIIKVTEVAGGSSDPIVITVNWVAPCGTHKSEVFVFDGGEKTFESTSSESGRAIALTFWATKTWTDAQGSHQIQSGFAACL